MRDTPHIFFNNNLGKSSLILKMSDLVEEFLAREKDGLAGLENEIPSAFDGEDWRKN